MNKVTSREETPKESTETDKTNYTTLGSTIGTHQTDLKHGADFHNPVTNPHVRFSRNLLSKGKAKKYNSQRKSVVDKEKKRKSNLPEKRKKANKDGLKNKAQRKIRHRKKSLEASRTDSRRREVGNMTVASLEVESKVTTSFTSGIDNTSTLEKAEEISEDALSKSSTSEAFSKTELKAGTLSLNDIVGKGLGAVTYPLSENEIVGIFTFKTEQPPTQTEILSSLESEDETAEKSTIKTIIGNESTSVHKFLSSLNNETKSKSSLGLEKNITQQKTQPILEEGSTISSSIIEEAKKLRISLLGENATRTINEALNSSSTANSPLSLVSESPASISSNAMKVSTIGEATRSATLSTSVDSKIIGSIIEHNFAHETVKPGRLIKKNPPDNFEAKDPKAVTKNITKKIERLDDKNEFKIMQRESLNKTINEFVYKLEQFYEQNITFEDSSFFYINMSKSDVMIVLPVLKNGSLSIYDVEDKLIQSGYFKNFSYYPDENFKNIEFCLKVVEFYKKSGLFLKKHYLEILIALGLIILLIILLLIFCCLRRRKKKTESIYTNDLKKKPYYASLEFPKRSKSAKDCTSSGSSGFELASPRRAFTEKARRSIQRVDNMMSHSRIFTQQKKPESKRLLSSSSDESEEDLKERKMPETETKSEDKRAKPVAEASPGQLHLRKVDDSVERIQILTEPSEDEFEEVKLTPKSKSPMKKEKAYDETYPDGGQKQPETTPIKKTKQLADEQLEGKDFSQERKRAELEKDELSPDSDEAPATGRTVRRLSRWVQRVFKPSRSTRDVDEEAGGSPPESSTLSTRSSLDVDKTFTSRRRRLLTFLSPSRRKERKRARIKAKKDLAPPVEVVVSESDYSLELAPQIDPSDLRGRIVATGDCKKIDDMLVKGGWGRSFYSSRGIQTMGQRVESLLQHSPEERRKVDAAKITDSQAQVMGVLSKIVSSPSLQQVVGQSMQRAEFSSLHPRAMSPLDLKASMKRRILP